MSDLATVLRDLAANDEYASGALDVLALLGLVTLDAGRGEPTSRVAGMALDVLRAHLADSVDAGLRWDDLEAPSPRGVEILRALEAARVDRVAQPTPARVVEAAQSIIKTRRGAEDLYLMQFDRHANRYQPIGGKREPGEADLTVTLRREMAEELGLADSPGPVLVTLTPVGSSWAETTLSATYGILTQYTFGFFHAADIAFPLSIDDDTHWLTRAEIAGGRAGNGRDISTIYQQGLGLDLLDGLPLSIVM
jgi:8-oxo-dGTP pyrophosphatase MutT (NUDIX family)